MHIVKQQGAPSCTSNLCLQGIIKVDRQHKHTPTQRNGLACAGWPLDRGKKNKKTGCTRNVCLGLLIIGATDSCSNGRNWFFRR